MARSCLEEEDDQQITISLPPYYSPPLRTTLMTASVRSLGRLASLMTDFGFRNGTRAQLYDSTGLDTAVQQSFFLHLSHLGIMCIIQVAAAEDFRAVLVFSSS